MAQRKDGAHAFNSEIRKRKVAARKMNRPPTLQTFQQFAQETNHPALGFSPAKAAAAAAGTSTQRDYSSATQSASSQKRYCKRCGWELPSTVTLLFPSLVKDQDPSGRITWTPAPGYEVETSHITDQHTRHSPYTDVLDAHGSTSQHSIMHRNARPAGIHITSTIWPPL